MKPTFKEQILTGIPDRLPEPKQYDSNVNHAPRRKDILSVDEKRLALRNALRYFEERHHQTLLPEFKQELDTYGRIYMYRFRPDYEIYARDIDEYPGDSLAAKGIMLMIQNNLDSRVAQHPHELITYGGNGAVFQNWAQYLLVMQYLSGIQKNQTLVINSGHPLGLFPSHKDAPRVVVTNGLMIPNYSRPDHWEKFNALGVTQYGQMTAGSYMYIGPQGIVHGTTITAMNALRKIADFPKPQLEGEESRRPLFVTSGLGGMSGAQPKAGNIAGCITVCAEVNPKAVETRHRQGWVDEVITNIDTLCTRVRLAQEHDQTVSIAYQGNVVDVWEKFYQSGIYIDFGTDQTSLHNPWAGGYYPAGLTFEQGKELMENDPDAFKDKVRQSLRRHTKAINKHTEKGTYFFDYGNAFLLEASRAGAKIHKNNKGDFVQAAAGKEGQDFAYPSYVEDIMGPMCFDYGFGPFRWVCASGKEADLKTTDELAQRVLQKLMKKAPQEIKRQLQDNIQWIKEAQDHQLVVGSKARILYADAWGRIEIAKAFNNAIAKKKIGPIILGRDHHDVSGTDSPFRETSNIYDGSRFTADMAIQNVIGDSFRGASWVSIHNGGGVGWGEAINGGFGMILDGTRHTDAKLKSMLFWDVNSGIARRAWARNTGAMATIKRAMEEESGLSVTFPNLVDDSLLENMYND